MQKFKKIFWTGHVEQKMRQYGLSKNKLLKILDRPERVERGIAPGTTALMETKKNYANINSAAKKKAPPGEIWLMYADIKEVRRIISAWRYPGISKPGEEIPIPKDIREQLKMQN